MSDKKNEIRDDEFRVIGHSTTPDTSAHEKSRRNLGVAIVSALIVIAIGILAVIFCLFKPVFPFNIAAAYLIIASYSTEWLSFPAFILIYMYNQKQGKKLGRYKYLFYAFYPVHLLLLFVIRLLIAKALTQ